MWNCGSFPRAENMTVLNCHGRAFKTSDFHTGGPRPSSSAPGQGALSSLPSLSEETLNRRYGV